MITAVIIFILEKSGKFFVIPMIETVFTQIITLFGTVSIESFDSLQTTKATTSTKKKVQSELAMATFNLAKPLRAYAASTGNLLLLDMAKKSYSQLNRLNQEHVKPICSALISKADELKTSLEPFGLTPGMITTANEKMALWDIWSSAVKLKRAGISAGVSMENKVIRQIIALMESQLDPLVNSIPNEQEIVDKYNLLRQIDLPGRTVTQLLFQVMELRPNGVQVPVYQADIATRITYTDKKGVTRHVEKQGKTEIEGEVSFRPVRYGFYDWEVTKAGFVSAAGLQTRVTQGKINRIEVLLMPEAGE